MSTRSQLCVKQEGLDWEEKITLYHHCDGYPSSIIPLVAEAYKKYGGSWEAGRAGKVASFLCAIHPGQFEPEEGHELHGDIAYYYILYVRNSANGSCGEKPTWEISVHEPGNFKTFWDNPKVESLTILYHRTEITQAKKYLDDKKWN